MCYTDLSIFTAHMSPTLNRSFALQRFQRGNAVKLCNGAISTRDCHICILSKLVFPDKKKKTDIFTTVYLALEACITKFTKRTKFVHTVGY